MTLETTTTIEQKIRDLNDLKEKTAKAQLDLKDELKKQKTPKTGDACDGIIKKYVAWSLAAGVIPVPFVDLLALTGIQIKMLDELAEQFGMNYSENQVRNTLHALTGGVLAPAIATGPIASMLKIVPVIGQLGGILVSPAVAGASTYAVGHLFLEHFSNGGTLDSFDTAAARRDYETRVKKQQSGEATGSDAIPPKTPVAEPAAGKPQTHK
jgi:uncharacterized protein (DUF697 family)